MLAKNFDVLIVGIQFESLFLAKELIRNGKRVQLIDSSEPHTESPFLNPNDSFFSSKSTLDDDIEVLEQEDAIQIFEAGDFKPFMGFTKAYPEFDFSPYLHTKYFQWKTDKESLLNEYLDELQEYCYYQTNISHLEVVDGEIKSVEINEERQVRPTQIIWTSHFKSLEHLLSTEEFSKKNMQALAKAQFWTRMDLHLLHKEDFAANLNERYLLKAAKDEARASFGRFYKNPEEQLCSQWTSFISSDLAESGEELGNLLRETKRQLKRAFSELFESSKFEKIQIIPEAYNNMDLQLGGHGQLPKISNAFILNHTFHRLVHKNNDLNRIKNQSLLYLESSPIEK